MSVTQKKVIFFTADTKPSTAEAAAVSRLKDLAASPYLIQVRNGGGTAKMTTIETCDYVAGTVPTAYAAKTLFGADGKIDASRPLSMGLFPATATLAATNTLQLRTIKAAGTNVEDIALSSITSDAAVTYSSSATAKATVSSGGLVTAVATGSATITATYTYATGKTVTATCAITVS